MTARRALAACGRPGLDRRSRPAQSGDAAAWSGAFFPGGGFTFPICCGRTAARRTRPFYRGRRRGACRAVSALCGMECRIKWPNDLLFEG
jgi:hypothetical protein